MHLDRPFEFERRIPKIHVRLGTVAVWVDRDVDCRQLDLVGSHSITTTETT
jgi:hypothetical protein